MSEEWMLSAKCREWPMATFFFTEGSRHEPWRVRRAQAICEGCPVRRECLEYALKHEIAGSIPLGYASFVYKVHDAAGNFVGESYKWKQFQASSTPPDGIYGGFTALQRHARAFKHNEGCKRAKCPGCKPLVDWVNELLEGSTAA